MKTATLPAVRIEPALRQQVEHLLAEGESLSNFVESAVRDNVARRLAQAEFVARGMASLDAAKRSGRYVSAASVVKKLETRLTRARAAQHRKAERAAKG